MKTLEQIYLDILLEGKYDNETWIQYDTYKGIELYVRRDGHLQRRLKERYSGLSQAMTKAFIVIKKLIKEELKNPKSILVVNDKSEFSFTVVGEDSGICLSGRFKKNAGEWRCCISTALPSEDAHHSGNDIFRIVKA